MTKMIEMGMILLQPYKVIRLIILRNHDGSFASNDGDDGGPLHHADSITPLDTNLHYKLPADPWVLRVRWRKDGMYPPGTVPPGSTHSSQVDLRRHSIASLSSSSGAASGSSLHAQEGHTSPPHGQHGHPHEPQHTAHHSRESQHSQHHQHHEPNHHSHHDPSQHAHHESTQHTPEPHLSPTTAPAPETNDAVIMHLDIQLYEMEPGVYLVDFKCAGYETSQGELLEEKDVTSPFPFLDLASRLIIQLAEAD